jgi:hypothetical protein
MLNKMGGIWVSFRSFFVVRMGMGVRQRMEHGIVGQPAGFEISYCTEKHTAQVLVETDEKPMSKRILGACLLLLEAQARGLIHQHSHLDRRSSAQ